MPGTRMPGGVQALGGRLPEVLVRRSVGRMAVVVRAPGGRRYRLHSVQLIRVDSGNEVGGVRGVPTERPPTVTQLSCGWGRILPLPPKSQRLAMYLH